jgi:LmbE family N-acetylglucosaminyl deacetylase
MRRAWLPLLVALVVFTAWRLDAQSNTPVPPDPRFKLDLLLIVAHPDDDTLAGTYMAKLIVDEGKRVGVVYCTPGDSGGNQEGPEHGPALGAIRQIEARRGLMTLGITSVWFLSGHDTAGQDPLRSLANWGHGQVLADAVRLIRLTRPEVVLTWMPMQVAGENHGDHQASSVVATEAFDVAGDPAAFPEQLAAPTQMFENLLEGLRPWQPKKLYFMSDAISTEFMKGHGPSYSVIAQSKDGTRYWEYVDEMLQSHATQYKRENAARAALSRDKRQDALLHAPPGDALLDPLRLVLGKSAVGGAVAGEVFQAVLPGPIPFSPATREPLAKTPGLQLELGGAWRFYHAFWHAHGLNEMAAIDLHDFGPVRDGGEVRVPLVVINDTSSEQSVSVTATFPAGWMERQRPTTIVVPANGQVEFTSSVTAHAPATGDAASTTYQIAGGVKAAPLTIRVFFEPRGNVLPQ